MFPMDAVIKAFRVFRCSLLIAGTTIGAGMLGIPLVTSGAGFYPAVLITTLVWLFMVVSGLYLLEATISRPQGSSFLSLSEFYLGKKGRAITGFLFLFLYYFLMVAYFAAGAPLLAHVFEGVMGMEMSLIVSYLLFGFLFGAVVAIGPKSIDAVNVVLTVAMAIVWVFLVCSASFAVSASRLSFSNPGQMIFAMPILFSAFGYHNIIPSLCGYMKNDRSVLRMSIIVGTAIPFVVYLIWQWLIIGSVDPVVIAASLKEGKPVTDVLKEITQRPWVALLGQWFALLAISTSVLGVSFSIVDFLKDGLAQQQKKLPRAVVTFLVFFPPFLLCLYDPKIFDRALSIAGGIGEALLNGLIPVAFAYILRYKMRGDVEYEVGGEKLGIGVIAILSIFVMGVEAFLLLC